MNKSSLPAYLKNLLQTYECSEEAKAYLVQPPAQAGSAYEFDEPYFHAHNGTFRSAPMSEELHGLVSALAAGLTSHIASYTQVKHNLTYAVVLSDEDRERFSLVLGRRLAILPDHPSGTNVVGWAMNPGSSYNIGAGGPFTGTFLGIRTELGIFPFANMSSLMAEGNKLRAYHRSQLTPVLGSDTIYHHAAPTGSAWLPGDQWQYAPYGSARQAGLFPNPNFPTFNNISPFNNTGLFSRQNEAEESGPLEASRSLAKLFEKIKLDLGITPQQFGERIAHYVDNQPNSDGNIAAINNLNIEFGRPTMTWKVFTKALTVLGANSFETTVRLTIANPDDDGDANLMSEQRITTLLDYNEPATLSRE